MFPLSRYTLLYLDKLRFNPQLYVKDQMLQSSYFIVKLPK